MKSISIVLLSFLALQLNAQTMETASQSVAQLFIATDNHNWTTVESIFDDQVVLDYSSMNGNPAATLTPKQITDSWKGVLPGFTFTHHQIGNVITQLQGDTAHVFCYGTATHYLEDEKGNIWTVVGSYNFQLINNHGKWRVSKMKFNFKYQDGNTSLPAKAIEKLKQ